MNRFWGRMCPSNVQTLSFLSLTILCIAVFYVNLYEICFLVKRFICLKRIQM